MIVLYVSYKDPRPQITHLLNDRKKGILGSMYLFVQPQAGFS